MQCPPTRPGLKGKKFHLLPAASKTASVSILSFLKSIDSSFIKAIFKSRWVFSITLAASATFILGALCVPAVIISPYNSSTKSAIIGFTKYIATHYSEYGLRANILVPGGVKNVKQSKKFITNYSHLTPLKRLAKKNEYKNAVLFLVSNASSYMTGSELIIDGGWTAW